MSGPLHGVRVLDLTSMISGPLTTMLLADQGADVIKVENPRGGDLNRHVSTARNGMPASFLNNNRNKRSLVIDLKDERGVRALKALARTADVLVQNFRPGVVERLGIGPDELRGEAPGLVYVSIFGFGDRGPYARKPVYDPLIQAVSGLASVQGGSDSARPRLVRTIVPDKLTGYACAQAVTAALYHKARTGEGQAITLNMLDAVIAFLWSSDMGGRTLVGDEVPVETAQSWIDLIYETRDGYLSVAVNTDREWAGLCRALGRPELIRDPRFETPRLRHRNIDERLSLTQEMLSRGTSAEWLARLEAEDVGCAPVLTRAEMIAHPQVTANETVIESDHAVAGRVRQARPAARFSRAPFEIRHGAPGFGEHSVEVLREAGLGGEEIAAMVSDGVVIAGPARSGGDDATEEAAGRAS